MPARAQIAAFALLTLLLLVPALRAYDAPTAPAPRPFRYDTDTFSFANETVWNYVNGSVQNDPQSRKRDYTRRCFVVTRAAVQFWKFARFDPRATPLPPDQLVARIRQVTARSVWLPFLAPRDRIVFPGFANLRALSASNPSVFQANMGLGWPVYFRAGNMPIAMPIYRETEAQLSDEIRHDLAMNFPTIVWLYNFPSLSINHVVVIFGGSRTSEGFRYEVYDPNYAGAPKHLDYNAATRTFSYPPTFYFKGGTVQARAIYRGVLQ